MSDWISFHISGTIKKLSIWQLENPAFGFALYLSSVHFRDDLQHGCHVGEQKIKLKLELYNYMNKESE